MVGAQDECLGIADHDMQPVKHTAVGDVDLMLVGVILQGWNITAVTIAADRAALRYSGMGKFLHGGLLDILCHAHFEVLRIATLIQGQGYENLRLFRAAAPLAACFWAAKVGVVKLHHTRQDMSGIPLPHSGSDAPEHGPCGFIGNSNLAGQLDSGDPSLVLGDEIERQEPFAQADVAMVQDRPGCDGSLVAAVGTLVQAVRQAASVSMTTLRTDKPVRPALSGQTVPATFVRSKPAQKLTQGHPLFP